MENRSRRISGSLNSLEVFEAAVRLCNLSLAARELGISQPAVSNHIAILEGRMSQKLFIRRNNRIAPTANARKMAEAIALGLDHINQTWTEVSSPPRRNEVTIACSFGFADQWLMQRFSELRSHMGDTQVHVITTDRLRNMDMTSIDIAVVWNLDDVDGLPSIPLIREEVFPICSPGFLSEYPEAATNIASLPGGAFLHGDVGNSGFLTWRTWFSEAGINPPQMTERPAFDTYPFLIQAVRRGEGVALGWKGVIDRSLAEGEIVRLGPTVSSRETSYFAFHHPSVDDKAARLLEWFRSQALVEPPTRYAGDRDLSGTGDCWTSAYPLR